MTSPYKFKVTWMEELTKGTLKGMLVEKSLRHVSEKEARKHIFKLVKMITTSNVQCEEI